MKPSDDLFCLIKSLTKTEKRYFKRFCKLYSSDKQNNYLKLFDAIEKQYDYDEKKIKEKFRNEKFVKQLHVTKKYLHSLVLKSLRMFNESNSLNANLWHGIVEIDLLAHKRLFEQSYKLLRQTLKTALQKEEFLVILELYRLEKQLCITFDDKDLIDKLQEISGKEQCEIKKKLEYDQYLLIESKMAKIEQIGEISNSNNAGKEYIDKLKSIMTNQLMDQKKGPSSIKSGFVYLRLNIDYFKLIENYSEAFKYSAMLLNLFENEKVFYEDNFIHYCGVIFNHIWIAFRLKKYNVALENLNMLDQFLDNSAIRFSKSFYTKLYLGVAELKLLFNNVSIKTNDENTYIEELEIFLKSVRGSIDHVRLKTIYIYISIHFLIEGRYDEALRWINKLLNNLDANLSVKYNTTAFLVSGIIHFELNNFIYLEKLNTSFRTYLRKVKMLDCVEYVSMQYLIKIGDNLSKKDRIGLFKELRKIVIKDLSKRDKLNELLEFDFLSWVDSKLQNKSYLEIISDKAGLFTVKG